MKASHASLAQRRHGLLEKIAAERRMMATALVLWRQPLALIDLATSSGRFMRRHPLAVALGCAAFRVVLHYPLARLGMAWWYGRRVISALAKP